MSRQRVRGHHMRRHHMRRLGRRWTRRLVLLLLAPLLLLVPAAPGTGPARAATEHPAAVLLESLTPGIGRPGDELRLAGRVANRSGVALEDVQVQLRYSRNPVTARSELGAISEGNEVLRSGVGVASTLVDLPAVLQPGEETPFELRVALDDLRLGPFGVYVLGVEVLSAEQRVGLARTFLPWVPGDVRPLHLAWLWPLVDVAHRSVSGAFGDDALAASLGGEGRLERLVAAGAAARLPLTWVLDPMLLDDAEAMAGGYRLGEDEQAPDDPEPQAARAWLERVRSATADAEAYALPYADPDVVALVRQGFAPQVSEAVDTGRVSAEKALGAEVGTDLAWPPDGRADAATAAVLRSTGARALVVRESALPLTVPLSYTPTDLARIDAGGPLDALLADDTLGDLAAAATPGPDTLLLAAQRFLAETALIAAERPCCTRTVLVAPPRRWDPAPAYLRALLEATATAPWLEAVPLRELRTAVPPEVERGPLTYPPEAVAAELPGSYLQEVSRVRREAATTPEVLTSPEDRATLAGRLALGPERLRSSAYREVPAQRQHELASLREDLRELRQNVRVLPVRSLTFGAREGPLPVTVVNDLDTPVTVRLALTPRVPKLEVGGPQPVQIAARRRAQVLVPAEAIANGVVSVDAQLSTLQGEPYGGPVELRVRVQQVGTAGLVVTVGAAGLLFVAAGTRIVRRLRRSRREAAPTA